MSFELNPLHAADNAPNYVFESDAETALPDPIPVYFCSYAPIPINKSTLPRIVFLQMIDEVQITTQSSYELSFAIGITLAATLFQKRYKIHLKDDWQPSLNIWSLILLISGGGKSPTFKHLVRPFEEWENKRQAEVKALNKPINNFNSIIQKQIDNLKSTKKAKAAEEIVEEIEALEKQIKPVYAEPRLFARNATPEALMQVLHHNSNTMTVMSDEGIGFLEALCGRYSKGEPNDSDINSCWDGQSFNIDRVGRENIKISNPRISTCLCLQDEKFRKLDKKEALLASGHLFRYLFITTKQDQGNRTYNENSMPADIVKQYADYVHKQLSVEPTLDEMDNPTLVALYLSSGANKLFQTLWNKYETSTKSGNPNDETHLAAYINKMKDNVARIAGILHCLTNECPEATQISASTMETAGYLAEVFTENFKQAFDLMEIDTNQQNAQMLLEWIKTHGNKEFAEQTIWQAKKDKSRFKKIEAIKNALKILSERNYIFCTNTNPAKYRLNQHLINLSPNSPKT